MEQGLTPRRAEGWLPALTVALTPSSPSASECFFFPRREPAGRGAQGAEEEAGGEGAAWAFCECPRAGAGRAGLGRRLGSPVPTLLHRAGVL